MKLLFVGAKKPKTYDAQLEGDIMHIRNRLGALTPLLRLVDGEWVYLGELPIHRFTVSVVRGPRKRKAPAPSEP